MIQISLIPNNNHLRDNLYARDVQAMIFEEQLIDLYQNPGWYLDNLENLCEYRVEWVCYNKQKNTIPLKYTRKKKTFKKVDSPT